MSRHHSSNLEKERKEESDDDFDSIEKQFEILAKKMKKLEEKRERFSSPERRKHYSRSRSRSRSPERRKHHSRSPSPERRKYHSRERSRSRSPVRRPSITERLSKTQQQEKATKTYDVSPGSSREDTRNFFVDETGKKYLAHYPNSKTPEEDNALHAIDFDFNQSHAYQNIFEGSQIPLHYISFTDPRSIFMTVFLQDTRLSYGKRRGYGNDKEVFAFSERSFTRMIRSSFHFTLYLLNKIRRDIKSFAYAHLDCIPKTNNHLYMNFSYARYAIQERPPIELPFYVKRRCIAILDTIQHLFYYHSNMDATTVTFYNNMETRTPTYIRNFEIIHRDFVDLITRVFGSYPKDGLFENCDHLLVNDFMQRNRISATSAMNEAQVTTSTIEERRGFEGKRIKPWRHEPGTFEERMYDLKKRDSVETLDVRSPDIDDDFRQELMDEIARLRNSSSQKSLPKNEPSDRRETTQNVILNETKRLEEEIKNKKKELNSIS